MIWQNPWALSGLLLVALPILIHLLSRRRAVRQKFPTLRFLDVTRLLPTRSPNLSDILLLLVRVGILAAATIALTQPLWVSANRRQTLNSSLARAILIDTSGTMTRRTADGVVPADSARARARQLAADATTSITMQTVRPGNALDGALAWLATQAGRGELVVVSDFQAGAIDTAALARVPARFGVQLLRVAGAQPATFDTLHTVRTTVVAAADARQTTAEWTLKEELPDSAPANAMTFAVADAERASLNAARRAAAIATSSGVADGSMPVVIVFPGAPDVDAIRTAAATPASAWMGTVLLATGSNQLLRSAVRDVEVTDTALASPWVTVARNTNGAPVVYAAQATHSGATRLVFVVRTPPASLASAALIAALSSAIARPNTLAESEPTFLSDAAIAARQREPAAIDLKTDTSAANVAAGSGLSDGRWLWLVALLLLAAEWYLRRKAGEAANRYENAVTQSGAPLNNRTNTVGGAL